MLTKKIKFFPILALCFAIAFVSCESEEFNTEETTQNFVDPAIEAMHNGAIGRYACLEFIFPIVIEFVDGTTASADDYDGLKDLIIAWKEANPEAERADKPQLLFPIDVLNDAGEVITVESKMALKSLKRECKSGSNKGDKDRKGRHCFSLTFPLSLEFADGTISSFDDKSSLKEAVRAYKAEAGEDAERPNLVYPITIQYQDERTAIIENQEALQAAKEACQDD